MSGHDTVIMGASICRHSDLVSVESLWPLLQPIICGLCFAFLRPSLLPVLDLTNLPIEARVILDRQDRGRALQNRELREHIRMNGRKRFSSSILVFRA